MPEFSAPEYLPWWIALAALSGLLWGSFLNVCIFRVVRDLSVVRPRSFCPQCEVPIAWYDNIPLLSYLLLRAKCRHCRATISIRYPLVELLTAVLLATVVWRYGVTLIAFKWAVFESLMIALFWTDLDVQILPDEFTLSGIVLGFLFAFFTPVPSMILSVLLPGVRQLVRSLLSATLGCLLIPLPLWAFAALYKKVRKLEMDPLGFGDIKLMCLFGAFFGFEKAIPIFIGGTIAAAILGVVYLAMRGRSAWKTEIPFGSFLCAAGALAALTGNAPA